VQFVEDAPDLPVAVVPADHGDESSLAAKAQSQSDQTAPANCGASAHPFAIWLSQKSLIPIDIKDCDYICVPSRLESDPIQDWLSCLSTDLSARPGDGLLVAIGRWSSDLIGA